MRRCPAVLIAIIAALLCAAPAGAHGLSMEPAKAGGQSPGELLGDIWVGSLSGRHLPFLGSCTTYARTVVVPHPTADGKPVRCSMRRDQSMFFGWGAFCGTFDAVELDTRAEQLECALGYDEAVESIAVSVDGGRPFELVRPRFEFATAMRWVRVAAGNDFGIPPQDATFTAHGWAGLLKGLRPGRHQIVRTVTIEGFDEQFSLTVKVSVSG